MIQRVHSGKFLLSLLVLAAAGMLAAPATAHEHAGGEKGRHRGPQLTLNAQASAEISQDTVKITLASELSDASQDSVADTLAKTLASTMKQAKDHPGIKVSSGNYRLWPVSNKEGKITNWHGRGEIFLESTDFAAASALATQLSDRMPIANLAFFVSPAVRTKQESELLTQAAESFSERAAAATRAFGFSSYTVRSIDLGGAGAQYQPVMRMVAMSADKAAVPLEAGTETVTVSVQGSIFLHSSKK